MAGLVKPSEVASDKDLIERHAGNGNPKIYLPCGECDKGRVPGAREGTTKKCPTCKGKGAVGSYYTRTTTFIDVLDDKANLAKWKMRMVLEGIRRDPSILEEFIALEDPHGADKAETDRLAHKAQEVADAGLKAALGTALHEITEDLDGGNDLGFIPDEFVKDIATYEKATQDLQMVAIETFGVLDLFKVAGTFDRLCIYKGRLMVADIKTGGIEYGLGKIAMQLAAYSRMLRYDPKTYERFPLVYDGLTVDQNEALIIHMPSGGGETKIVTVDIEKGWQGLHLAQEVRDWRSYWNRKSSKGEVISHVTASDLDAA